MAYKSKEITKMVEDLFKDSIKFSEKEELVNVDLKGEYPSGSNFIIPNPFYLLNTFMRSMQDFIGEPWRFTTPVEKFKFTKDFQNFPTFLQNLQESDFLNEDEYYIIKSNIAIFMLKLFLANQATIQLDDSDIEHWKEFENLEDSSDEEIILVSEFKTLDSFYRYKSRLGEIDEDKIKKIYQKYSNDDNGKILKPFVDEFIPNYKNLFNSKKLIPLIFNMTKKYQKFEENNQLRGPYIINYFYNDLPKSLIDSPGDSYDNFFKIVYQATSEFIFDDYVRIIYNDYPFPKQIQQVKGKINSLEKQKYSIIYKIIEYFNSNQYDNVNDYDYVLFFSLFPWKFDDDSQEARDLEEYYTKSVKYLLESDELDELVFKPYLADIKEKILPAQNPLSQKEFKQLFTGINKEKDATCSKCCNIY